MRIFHAILRLVRELLITDPAGLRAKTATAEVDCGETGLFRMKNNE
jgi:hypothetical protein